MVIFFVAGMFLLCVIVDYFVQPHKNTVEAPQERFVPGLGLCMADGGEPVARPIDPLSKRKPNDK